MKIGIDARFYGPVGKGLGRYTQEVVDNLIKINEEDGDNEYVIFLSDDNFDEFTGEGARVRKVRLRCAWYSWQEQVFLPYRIWREHLDLVHFPHFNVPLFTPVRFVVTIHDLILTHFPTLRATTRRPISYFFKNLAYRLVIGVALRRARRIITVSEFTKQDLIDNFPVSAEKITVTYEGVANLSKARDSLFVSKLNNQEILDEYHIPPHFLLYVGNAYPHKNLETLLRVFAALRSERPDLRLVLVGKIDFFYARVQRTAAALNIWQKGNINSPVIFPGYVPDAQLEVFYAEARAYVFPSLYEGFGLPPLEAMAHGCPVLSSDRGSLPEILGPAAEYFNPEKIEDMAAKIALVLDQPDRRERLGQLGREQVKKYNWWECARQTSAVYRSALKS